MRIILIRNRRSRKSPAVLPYPRLVLVVNRFRGGDDLRPDLEAVHALLAGFPGYVDGAIGRNLDEPDLWVLTTRWENVGAYRRALSSYDVKLKGIPVLSRALDEPGAYEVVEPNAVLNEARSRVT